LIKISQKERDTIKSYYKATFFTEASKNKCGRGVDKGKTYYCEPSNNVYKLGKKFQREGLILSFEWQEFISEKDAEIAEANRLKQIGNKNK